MRQKLLNKPTQLIKKNKKEPDVVQTTECDWHEPFVLYYNEEANEKRSVDESLLKFTIQMGYEELTQKKKEVTVVEHLVGEHESFHLDQFSEGEIYLKEIRFGSKQSKNDILGFDTPRESDQEFGGTLLMKIQLLREEETLLEEVMCNCSQKVIAMEEYMQFLRQQFVANIAG